jgi:selenoprotein W-related protein
VSLVNDLLKKFEPEIETVTLIPSNGGRFEVNVNDTLVYSKLQTGHHAEPGEVVLLIEKILKKK